MSIKDKYRLRFSKISSKEFSDSYVCNWNNSIEGSVELGMLLETVSDVEAESLLEAVEMVISGTFFEEDYVPDCAIDVWVDFKAPNAVISDSYTMPLEELKELLEEWVRFVNL